MNVLLVLAFFGARIDDQFKAAQKAYENGLFEAAIQGYQEVLRGGYSFPKANDALYNLGDSYFRTRDTANAAFSFANFVTNFPSDERAARAFERSVEYYLAVDKPEPAYTLLVQNRHFNPPPSLVTGLAERLAGQRSFEHALDVYNILPTSAAGFRAAQILLDLGRPADARTRLSEVVARDSSLAQAADLVRIRSFLAEQDTLGAYDVAITLRNVHNLTGPQALDLGSLFLRLRDLDNAESFLRQALTDKALVSGCLPGLALVYRLRRQYDRERDAWAEYTAYQPADVHGRYNLDRANLLAGLEFDRSTVGLWDFADLDEFATVVSRLIERGFDAEAAGLLATTTWRDPRFEFWRAELAVRAKDDALAFGHYRRFIEQAVLGPEVGRAQEAIDRIEAFGRSNYEQALDAVLKAETPEAKARVLFDLARDYGAVVRMLDTTTSASGLYLRAQALERLAAASPRSDDARERAVAGYGQFIAAFPEDSLVETAEFARTRLMTAGRGPAQRIPSWDDFLARYPTGRFADQALLVEADAFVALGDQWKAQEKLSRLLMDFPASPLFPTAMLFLARLQLAAGDTATATGNLRSLALVASRDSVHYLALRSLSEIAARAGAADSSLAFLDRLGREFEFLLDADVDRYARLARDQGACPRLAQLLERVARTSGENRVRACAAECRIDAGAGREGLRQLLAVDPARFEAEYLFYRGLAGQNLGYRQIALAAFRRLETWVEPSPYAVEARKRMAGLYVEQGAWSRALPLYAALAAAQPDSARLLVGQIRALYHTGQFEKGDTLLDRSTIIPAAARSQLRREEVSLLLDANLIDYAARTLVRLGAEDPSSFYSDEVAYEQALVEFKRANFDTAIVRFREFVSAFPRSPFVGDAYFKLGTAYYRQQNLDAARQSYERAAAEPRLARDALTNLAVIYKAKEDYAAAALVYRRMLDSLPGLTEGDRVDLEFRYAYALLRKGDFTAAFKLLQDLEGRSADDERKTEIIFWLAECYLGMGQPEKAAFEFLKIPYLYPEQSLWAVTARLRAGLAYEMMGKNDQAREIYLGIIRERGKADEWSQQAQERLDQLK